MKKCLYWVTEKILAHWRHKNEDCLEVLPQADSENGEAKNISLDEQANELLQFASKFVRGYVDRELNNNKSVFKGVDRERFLHERLIVVFWLIDKFLADPEHKLTTAIHEKYFKLRGFMQNREEAEKEANLIILRYKEYYDSWNDKSVTEQQFLASVIAKNIFGLDHPVMNAMVTFEISIDLPFMIKSLKDFSKETLC